MINRIFIQSVLTDYISYKSQVLYVTFDGLEATTQARLLKLGFSPPIQFRGGLDDEKSVQQGEMLCLYLPPRIDHLGNLEDWLEWVARSGAGWNEI